MEQLLAEEGDAAGSEFRQEAGVGRLAALVGKDGPCGIFERLMTHSGVMSYPAAIFGGGAGLKISSVNARVVPPVEPERRAARVAAAAAATGAAEAAAAAGAQPLHADFSAVADSSGPWVANVLVALSPYNATTGPLRAVPGSHKWGRLPAADMEDPRRPHPEEVRIVAERGDCIVMDAHCWHAGTENLSTDVNKAAVHLFWCRRDKPQQQHQRRWIPSDVQAGMSPLSRYIAALDSEQNEELMRTQADQPPVSGAIPVAAAGSAAMAAAAAGAATRLSRI